MAPQESPAGDKAPQNADTVMYDGKIFNVVKEGSAEILDLQRPSNGKKGASQRQSVFYNPIQQYNRDLSVLAIKAFAEDYDVVRKTRHHARLEKQGKAKQKGGRKKQDVAQDTHGTGAEDIGPGDVNTAESTGTVPDRQAKRKRDEDNDNSGDAEPKRARIDNRDTVMSERAPVDKAVDQSVDQPHPHQELSTEPAAPAVKVNGKQGSIRLAGQPGGADGDEYHRIQDKSDNQAGAVYTKKTSSQPAFRILDALSATGLRALRYAKEIPRATMIVANDVLPSATNAIKLNVKHNDLSETIVPNTSDAIYHMQHAASPSEGGPSYQVIDLDPYGTAAPFLDAAVRALVDGGLLCVTCTDAAVFASVGYLEKTYTNYGGLPIKGLHAHEGGLRLILHAIATTAGRYGLAIEPLLSLSIDFYVRIFVRIHKSPADVKFLPSKTMAVYSCDSGCGAWSIQHLAKTKAHVAKNGDAINSFTSALAPSANTLCEHCGFKTHLAGPMWGGLLHNKHFIQRILDMLPSLDPKIYGTIPRIEGMLTLALNETLEDDMSSDTTSAPSSPQRPIPPTNPAAQAHHPLFFLPTSLARVLHCNCPSEAQMRGALLNLGYRTTRSHTKGGSITTDAPWSVIWEIMREWVRQKSPVKEGAIKERTAGWGIMQKNRNSGLDKAKHMIRNAIDNEDVKDLEGLKKGVEAALYRISILGDIFGLGNPSDTNGTKNGNGHTTGTGDGGIDEPKDPSTVSIDGPSKTGNAEQEDPGPGHTRSSSPSRPPTDLGELKVVFDESLGKERQGKRMVRYQINPKADWGPMNRANG